MSNDNKDNLKADHVQHSAKQTDKRSKFSFTGFMSIIACLIMLLLIVSCRPQHAQTFTKLESINDILVLTAYSKESSHD